MLSFLKRLRSDPKKGLRKALGNFTLPTFPSVVMETLEKIRDPESSAAVVAQVLSADPGLTVKVLKTVNSAALSPSRRIEDIKQAVALMGMASLETLVLSLSVGDVLPKDNTDLYDFDEFWYASVLRGTLARAMADRVRPALRFESFTAGLLQDMALPFLAKRRPRDYGPILTEWREGTEDLSVLERKRLPWDHAEVATWICDTWDLPERLSLLIGEHHGSLDLGGKGPSFARLVSCIRDIGDNDGVDLFIEAAHSQYHVDTGELEEMVGKAREATLDLVRSLTS